MFEQKKSCGVSTVYTAVWNPDIGLLHCNDLALEGRALNNLSDDKVEGHVNTFSKDLKCRLKLISHQQVQVELDVIKADAKIEFAIAPRTEFEFAIAPENFNRQ